jgi:hypothetical protein
VIPIAIYARDSAGDTGYGLLLASWGLRVVFARLRRASLPVLLFFSTIAIGAGYLGMAAAPGLAIACGASAVGGLGNGVQWVAVISAVQELTAARMQARVIGTLESAASATPGIGFVLGGLIATQWSPRAAFFVAGGGVMVIVFVSALALGRNWPLDHAKNVKGMSMPRRKIMVEPFRRALPTQIGGFDVRKLPQRCWCLDWRWSRSASRHAGVGLNGKEGGTLTGSYASFPDYLDRASPTPPKAGRRCTTRICRCSPTPTPTARGSKGGPGAGRELPKVTSGGKTYTLTLRKGPQLARRHSGQGGPTASTVERVFKLNSPGRTTKAS